MKWPLIAYQSEWRHLRLLVVRQEILAAELEVYDDYPLEQLELDHGNQ